MDEIVGQCRPEQAILNEEWMVSEIEDLHKKAVDEMIKAEDKRVLKAIDRKS